MKFNSFIKSLEEITTSKLSDKQLSTDAIIIDQIAHPINNDRRELFYKYAKKNEVIQKFKNIVIGEIGNFTEKNLLLILNIKEVLKKIS